MNKIKYLVVSILILLGTTSFAAWSQPQATPPQGNTEPPINIGTFIQYKRGTIGAYNFCIYDTNGAVKSCLGGTDPNVPATSFPWVFNGKNIKNTNNTTANNGNILIEDSATTHDWIFNPTEKLTVEGKVKAIGFCLGNDCVQTNTQNDPKTTIVNSWQEFINKFVTGTEGPMGPMGPAGSPGTSGNPLNCKPGEVLTWLDSKWTCGQGGLTGPTGPTGPVGTSGPQGVPGYGVPTNCKNNQIAVWSVSSQVWICGDVTPLTGPAGTPGTQGQPGYGVPQDCKDGQVPVWSEASRVWSCGSASPLTGPAGIPGAQGQPGYGVPTNCANNQIAIWNGSSKVWECGSITLGGTQDGCYVGDASYQGCSGRCYADGPVSMCKPGYYVAGIQSLDIDAGKYCIGCIAGVKPTCCPFK